MELSSYYSQLIKTLEAAAQDAHNQAANYQAELKSRLEEAQLSSSKSDSDGSHKCEKECKYKKLLSKFSPELLAKLLEYNLDPTSISPRAAMKKLLSLGMPIEHVLLDLQEEGKNIGAVENLLAQHGLSSHLNTAIAKGLENRSISSSIAFAESLIQKKGSQAQNFDIVS